MRSWLCVLFCLTVLRTGWACETITLTIPKNETCYSHATFLNPESFAQFSNGTCVFHRVCGSKTPNNKVTSKTTTESCIQIDKKKMKFSVITTTTEASTKTRIFKWKCPTFDKVSTGKNILLMRTHAAKKLSPYLYFRQGNVTAHQMTIQEADANRYINFKSPLMASDKHASLTRIVVEMFDARKRRKTSITFRINPNESIQKGRWFAKDRLVTASPWSVSRMRRTKYNHFSIDGIKNSKFTRRFYINVSFGGCQSDRGYMMISEKPFCNYEKKNKRYRPSYIWTSFGSSHGRYNSRSFETTEFRIYGIFKTSPDHYVRKSENC